MNEIFSESLDKLLTFGVPLVILVITFIVALLYDTLLKALHQLKHPAW